MFLMVCLSSFSSLLFNDSTTFAITIFCLGKLLLGHVVVETCFVPFLSLINGFVEPSPMSLLSINPAKNHKCVRLAGNKFSPHIIWINP